MRERRTGEEQCEAFVSRGITGRDMGRKISLCRGVGARGGLNSTCYFSHVCEVCYVLAFCGILAAFDRVYFTFLSFSVTFSLSFPFLSVKQDMIYRDACLYQREHNVCTWCVKDCGKNNCDTDVRLLCFVHTGRHHAMCVSVFNTQTHKHWHACHCLYRTIYKHLVTVFFPVTFRYFPPHIWPYLSHRLLDFLLD